MTTPLKITQFKGVINKLDPARRPLGALDTAVNMEVDDAEKLRHIPRYLEQLTGDVADAYALEDESRAFLVLGDDLVEYLEDGTTVLLQAAVTGPKYSWMEIANTVYFQNGADVFLTISTQGVRQWGIPVPVQPAVSVVGGNLPAGQYRVCAAYVAPTGRESGAPHSTVVDVGEGSGFKVTVPTLSGHRTAVYISSTNGEVLYYAYSTDQEVSTWGGPVKSLVRPLDSQFLVPPPPAEYVTGYKGRIYASAYQAGSNETIIWVGRPQDYERFYIFDALLVPGRVGGLEGLDDGLVIGTDEMIYAYDERELKELATYGMIDGCSVTHDKTAYLWTERGLVKALPFEEMTEDKVSVPPGKAGTAAVLRLDGFERCVVLVEEGGIADNPYGG